jgi:DNA-binding CsgD family transcriptional regulator
MTLSISGTLSGQATDTPAPAQAATQQAQQPQPPPDTITLSQSAQVSQLHAQGQSPLQIAENLGIPVSTVDSDLGIVAANAASTPAHGGDAAHAVHPDQAAPAATSSESTSRA